MSPRLFGTDGIRAPFGEYPLDRATVMALGLRLGARLRDQTTGATEVVLGGDTRDSTPILAAWVHSGLAAAGVATHNLGVVPTPAVAHAVRHLGVAAGVAISASHNPHPDNGIKLFDQGGGKWSADDEASLERGLAEPTSPIPEGAPPTPDPSLVADYLDHLASTLPSDGLAGQRVVLDCAHGSTSDFAAGAFERHGGEVVLLHASPDGRNINQDAGSTRPETLAAAVLDHRADLGIAFDGDGDRALLVDETGEVRDGDAMLYLWARSLARRGELDPPCVVATSMSNLGLETALSREGIAVRRCDVGDRAVVRAMDETGAPLGGEQSGHIVYRAATTTGDGLLTGLQLAHLLRDGSGPASVQFAGFRRFPQLLRNVPVRDKVPFEDLPSVQAARLEVESALAGRGRLVLRYSGTERLARIMVEGPDQTELELLTDGIDRALRREIGA